MTAPSSLPGRAFRLLRRRLPALLAASLWPYFVLVGIYTVTGIIYLHTHPMYTAQDPVALWRDSSFLVKLGTILSFVASTSIPYGLAFAGISILVYEDYRGEESSLGSALKQVMRRWVAVVVVSFLLGCGGVFGLFLALVPGVILTMLTVFTIPVLLLEEAGVVTAPRRSMRLARDRVGSVLGLMVPFGMVFYLVVIFYFGLIGALNLDIEMTWAVRAFLALVVPVMMCVYCTTLAILYCDIRVSRGELLAAAPLSGGEVDHSVEPLSSLGR